jgi:hypothetical protein
MVVSVFPLDKREGIEECRDGEEKEENEERGERDKIRPASRVSIFN